MKKSVFAACSIFAIISLSCGTRQASEETQSSEGNNNADYDAEMTLEERLSPDGQIDGHYYVDLGLSVMWATMNVGANSPEEYGNYYAWGETTPKKEYSMFNSATYRKDIEEITGITNISDMPQYDFISGDPALDVARLDWGGNWEMPTKQWVDELVENCTCEFITYNKVNGWLLVSKENGKAIFLPAAGYRDNGVRFEKRHAEYWTGTADTRGITESYRLFIKDNSYGSFYDTDACSRYVGMPVRPIISYCSEEY